jgi:FkbM family methyltransferase
MARLSVKSLTLTAQVHLPSLADAKTTALAWYRRTFGRPRCAALRALRHFDLTGLDDFIDVGSAGGESVAALRALVPRARIVAIEPNPFYLNKVRTRFRHDAGISSENCALSDVSGPMPLYVPAYNYTLFPDLATLDRREAETWLSSRLLGFDPLRLSVLEMPSQSHTLDSLGLRPSLIRIDTRCDASAVIRGGTRTVALHRPIIAAESAIFGPDCVSALQLSGYRAFRGLAHRLAPASWPGPADLLLHDSHLARWRGGELPPAATPRPSA